MTYGIIATDTIQSSTTGTPPQFNDGSGTQIGTLCRAWVNFNGTSGSVAIRASFNVSSITYNGTGDYTVNFTNALSDANYGITGSVADAGGFRRLFNQYGAAAPTTSAVRVECKDASSGTTTANVDNTYMQVAIFR